jgi:hypothetical protein
MKTILKKCSLGVVISFVAFGTASLVLAADKPHAKKKGEAKAEVKAEAAAPEAAAPAAPAAPETPAAAEPAAAPKAEAMPAADTTAQATTSESPKSGGLLGPVSLGPTLSLSLPHPANFGIEGRFTDYLGFAINYGFLPELTILDAKLKMSSYDARVRVFPFGGAFFLGTSIGRQTFSASNTATNAGVTATVQLDATTTYFTPTLGWRWGGMHGFVFGMDFGWQMALSSSSALTVSGSNSLLEATADFQKAKADAEKAGSDIGSASLPMFTMLHFGYLF